MSTGEPTRRLKVLLVTADPQTRDIIRTGLEQFQLFDVVPAADAGGIQRARGGAFDLAVLDGGLAQPSGGFDLVRQLRELDAKCEVILLVPERAAKQLAKDKSSLDIFAVVSLPIEGAHFFKTIARAKDRILLK